MNESSPFPAAALVGEFRGEVWVELSPLPLMGGGENTLLIFSVWPWKNSLYKEEIIASINLGSCILTSQDFNEFEITYPPIMDLILAH